MREQTLSLVCISIQCFSYLPLEKTRKKNRDCLTVCKEQICSCQSDNIRGWFHKIEDTNYLSERMRMRQPRLTN